MKSLYLFAALTVAVSLSAQEDSYQHVGKSNQTPACQAILNALRKTDPTKATQLFKHVCVNEKGETVEATFEHDRIIAEKAVTNPTDKDATAEALPSDES